MDRFLKISGIILYIFLVIKYGPELFSDLGKWLLFFLATIGIISIFYVIIAIAFKKNLLFGSINNLIFGMGLVDSINVLLNELPKPKNATISNFLGQIAFRFIRIGFVAFMISVLPVLLLIQQNRLLSFQNKLFETQNKQIENQNQLIDGQRRSSLMFLFGNIVNMVNEDLKENKERKLSEQTISSIISLSKGLKPYRLLEDTVLSSKPLSPERGQLLLFIISSKINVESLDKIFLKSDFTFSDLRHSNLEGAYLKYCNLDNSELHNSNLFNINFQNASLMSTCLRNSNIGRANFTNSNLSNAIFDNAIFSDKTNLDSAIVNNKDWFDLIEMNEYSLILYFNAIITKYGIDTIGFALFGENKISLEGFRIINLNRLENINNIKLFKTKNILTQVEANELRRNILTDSNLRKTLVNPHEK